MNTTPTEPADLTELRAALGKSFPRGQMLRIPKHPERRNIVLAVIAKSLQRRYPYTEVELNQLLEEQLANLQAQVDHVTCRRYLVDFGFVKRDRAGTRYYLNYPKLEETLSEEAQQQATTVINELLESVKTKSHTQENKQPNDYKR